CVAFELNSEIGPVISHVSSKLSMRGVLSVGVAIEKKSSRSGVARAGEVGVDCDQAGSTRFARRPAVRAMERSAAFMSVSSRISVRRIREIAADRKNASTFWWMPATPDCVFHAAHTRFNGKRKTNHHAEGCKALFFDRFCAAVMAGHG